MVLTEDDPERQRRYSLRLYFGSLGLGWAIGSGPPSPGCSRPTKGVVTA
jgi:hypothetical protein